MTHYCPNCGSEQDEDAKFCQNCGITLNKLSEEVNFGTPAPKAETTAISPKMQDGVSSPAPVKKPHQRPTFLSSSGRPLKPVSKFVVAGFLIASLIVISVLFGGLLPKGNGTFENYESVAFSTFSVPEQDFTIINVDMDTSIGDLQILTKPNQENPVEATIDVFAVKQFENRYDEHNEISSTFSETGDILDLSFTSAWTGEAINAFNQNPFTYSIVLSVTSGFDYGIQLSSSTGTIAVDMRNSEIHELNLKTNTGSVDVHLSQVNITTNLVEIEASTGHVEVLMDELSFNTNTDWMMSASTGSVNLNLALEDLSPADITVQTFNLHTLTGSVVVEGTLPADTGVQVMAETNTGSIDLHGWPSASDFDRNATLKLGFDLSTTTGSIIFDLVVYE